MNSITLDESDAQVGAAVSVVLADEKFGSAALGDFTESLLAGTAGDAADVATLDLHPCSRVDKVVLVLYKKKSQFCVRDEVEQQ
jgi:hypothetical protein